MASSTTVQIEDVRAGLLAILDEVQRRFGGEIDLDADYYWDIDLESAFNRSPVPTPDIGSLVDDVDLLGELLQERADGELYIWHDLNHVIGILKRIAALDVPGLKSD
jgi:hypothetical protein